VDIPVFEPTDWAPTRGGTPPPANKPPTIGSIALDSSYFDVTEEARLAINDLADSDGTVNGVDVAWGDRATGYYGPQSGTTAFTAKHTYAEPGTYDLSVIARDDDGAESSPPKTARAQVSRISAGVTRAPTQALQVDVDVSGSQLALPASRTAVTVDGSTVDAAGSKVRVPVSAAQGTLDVSVYGTAPSGQEVRLGTISAPYDVPADGGGSDEPAGTVYFTRFVQNVGAKAFAWTIGDDGDGQRLTASPDNLEEVVVSASPDGSKIAVVRHPSYYDADQTPVTADDWSIAVYTVGHATPDWSRPWPHASDIAWSPDGRRLAVVAQFDGPPDTLDVLAADGTGSPDTVSRHDEIRDPAWSPDGDRIAVATTPQCTTADPCWGSVFHDVVIVDAETHHERSFTPDVPERLNDVFLPLGWDESGDELSYQRVHKAAGSNALTFTSGAFSDSTGMADETPMPVRLVNPTGRVFGSTVLVGLSGDGQPARKAFLDLDTGAETTLPDRLKAILVSDWLSPASTSTDVTPGPVITVTGTGDGTDDPGCNPAPGDCTLREAIDKVNRTDPDLGVPVIDLPDDGGPIRPTSPLPVITNPVVLVGGGGPDDLVGDGTRLGRLGLGNDDGCAAGPVVIDGSQAGPGAEGLRFRTGLDTRRTTVLHRIVVTGFGGDGVDVDTSQHVRLGCSSSVDNGGAGLGVHDSRDVTAIGDVTLAGNGGDGLRVTGASSRVRTWAGHLGDNGGLAIDLGDDGVTGNDAGDNDTGPNALLNRPVIRRIVDDPAESDASRLVAVVDVPRMLGSGRVDLYRNAACDPSGSGELQSWLGGAFVELRSTDGAPVTVRVPFRDGGAGPITAALTAGVGTSEASECQETKNATDPGPVAGTDPVRTVWPEPESTTGAGTGGTAPGDPSGGAGSRGTWGGDVPGVITAPSDFGPSGTADPSTGGGGTAPTPPDFDVDQHLVFGWAGEVSVEPPPGVLDDVVGGLPPYRAEKLGGGTIPDGAWSLDPRTGAVTLDARDLVAGGYSGLFRVRDARGDVTPTRTVGFVVATKGKPTPPRVPFVTRPDRVYVAPGQSLTVAGTDGVLRNDRADTPLTATRRAGGTIPAAKVTLRSGGGFTVDATGLTEGEYTFLYRAHTSDGLVSPDTLVTVVVDNGNQCPTAADDTWAVRAGEVFDIPAALGVLANDRDREGDAMTVKLVGKFGKTDIALRSDGSVYLDARAAKAGTFREFQYRAVDAKGESCAPATVRLNVTAGKPPVANDNYYEVAAGRRFVLPARGLLGNDFDEDGPESALTSAVHASLPGLTVNADGSLIYNAPSKLGRYVATYRAKDDLGQRSADAQIIFRVVAPADAPPVDRAPVANDDTFYRVHADETLLVLSADGVLANDSDPDGDELIAVASSKAARTRFPLSRDGSFLFKPRLSEVGQTLSFRYRAVEKGYTAAQSPERTVSVQVVAPRERCRTVEDGVSAVMSDDNGYNDLATTTSGFGWCWQGAKITRAGLTRSDGGFATSLRGPGSVSGDTEAETSPEVDAATVLWQVTPQTDDHATVSLRTGQTSAQLLSLSEYKACFNPASIAIEIALNLIPLEKIPGVGKVLRYVGSRGVHWVAEAVSSVFEAFGKVTGWLFKHIDPPEGLFSAIIDGIRDAGVGAVLGKVLDTLGQSQIQVDDHGTKRTLPVDEVLAMKLDADDPTLVKILDAVTCVPMSGVGWTDASELDKIQLTASPDYEEQGPPDGVNGLWDPMARWIQLLDLGQNGDGLEVSWTRDLTADDVVYIGCDLTRTRPKQAPVKPDPLPGDPPTTC
jgi:hypothetical protein